MEPKITIITDLDDCIWNLVDDWIGEYQKQRMYQFKWGILDDEHDKSLNKSMVTSWDIESCLNPTNKDMFWNCLNNDDFWKDMTVHPATIKALEAINSHPNIDLIICTDTYYKSATTKLTRFFELFPFIEPSQVICMKEKWRLDCDVLIDDKPETLEKFILKGDLSPMFTIKINQPWNTTTVCDYSFNTFNEDLAKFCIECAESYADVIKEIRREDLYDERCYYN